MYITHGFPNHGQGTKVDRKSDTDRQHPALSSDHIISQMWLLNTRTYELKKFDSNSDRPRYAILSHVWGKEEVSLVAIQNLAKAKKMHGFEKISQSCAVARQDGYNWIWIDTCCIDKTSSAELSEAINSMYAWYGEAEVCYAYLNDVKDSSQEDPSADGSSFRASRWFTRGWTLQELIAPRSLYFLAQNWRRLGTKRSLADVLQEVTLVSRSVLLHERLLDDVSIARRMSWASQRETTRIEDRAYSLMGIFSVNMPTIYGEGEKAFIRLQLEIIRQSPDQSIFAWGKIHSHQVFLDNEHSFSDGPQWTSEYRSLLASSPEMFAGSACVESVPLESFGERLTLTIPVPEYYPTNYGIHIHLPLYRMHETPMCFALLACRDKQGMIGLLLRRMNSSPNRYYVGLHGMYRPLRPPWHPYFRMFRVPTREEDKKRFLNRLVVADMYLHSYNPNPQRSRALGIADNQLRLHARTLHSTKPPEHFTFIVPGWLVKRLQETGFYLDRPKGEKPPGWTPTKAWTQKDSALTLTMRAPDYLQGVVLFRGPKKEAFALAVGVTDKGLAWAEGIVKGTAGSEDGDWNGSGHDAAKRIWSKYSDVGSVEDLGLDQWKFGTRKFGDEKMRAVKVTFTPWLADEERGVVGKGTVTYTVGIELRGKMYLEWKRLSSSDEPTEKASTTSRIANFPRESRRDQ